MADFLLLKQLSHMRKCLPSLITFQCIQRIFESSSSTRSYVGIDIYTIVSLHRVPYALPFVLLCCWMRNSLASVLIQSAHLLTSCLYALPQLVSRYQCNSHFFAQSIAKSGPPGLALETVNIYIENLIEKSLAQEVWQPSTPVYYTVTPHKPSLPVPTLITLIFFALHRSWHNTNQSGYSYIDVFCLT